MFKLIASLFFILFLFPTLNVNASHSVIHDEYGIVDMIYHEDGIHFVFSPNARQRELNILFNYDYATRLQHPDGLATIHYTSDTHEFIWIPLNPYGEHIIVNPFIFPFSHMEGFFYSVWCDEMQGRVLYLFNPDDVRSRRINHSHGIFALHDEHSLIRIVPSNNFGLYIRPNSRQTALANSFDRSIATRLAHPDGPASLGILIEPYRFIWMPLDITGTVLDVDPFSHPFDNMEGFLFSVWCNDIQDNVLYLFNPPVVVNNITTLLDNPPQNQSFILFIVIFAFIIVLFIISRIKKLHHVLQNRKARNEWNKKYSHMKNQWDNKAPRICMNCEDKRSCHRCRNFRAGSF